MTDYTLAIRTPDDVKDVRVQALKLEEILQSKIFERLGKLEHYTLPERQAIVELEKLKLLLDVEKVPFFAKIKIAFQVSNSWMNHPDKASNLKEFVELNTPLSYSEFSNLVDIHSKIIPYLESQNLDPLEMFMSYRPSNIREIVPVLKAAITGEPSKSPEVNELVERMKADARDIDPNATEGEITKSVVDKILEEAGGTNRNLKKFLRPNNTPPILLVTARKNGTTIVFAEVDNDQLVMLQQLAQGHIDIYPVDFQEAKNTPIIKMIIGEKHG